MPQVVHGSEAYSETSIIRTPTGPPLTVLFMEVSLFQRFYIVQVNVRDAKWGRTVMSSRPVLWLHFRAGFIIYNNRGFTVYSPCMYVILSFNVNHNFLASTYN